MGLDALIAWFTGLPVALAYVALGVGAALENIVPAIPADTFVVLGGILSVRTGLEARWVFVATWVANVGSALVTYGIGYRHVRGFFEGGWGRFVLNPHQMMRMRRFFERRGTWAILLARFLPGIRSIVPVFAGVSHLPPRQVAVPVAVASGVWYGGLVWLGAFAGRNLDQVLALLGHVRVWLLGGALLVVVLATVWWWRTRHHHE